MDKALLCALRGEVRSPPPIWLMRQAGRYLPEYRRSRQLAGSFLELCYTPALAAEVTLQPIERFGFDAAIVFSDILVVPDALGVEVGFHPEGGPRLVPVKGPADIAALTVDGIEDRLSAVYEAIEMVAKSLPEGVALVGFAGAPWTVATYMVEGGSSKDFAATKLWAFNDPGGFGRLIEVIVEATVRHLVEQVRHGADAIQIFDSWAGVLPESGFHRWCTAPTRAVVDGFRRACPEAPVIGFARGIGECLPDYAEATGIDAVSIDAGVAMGWAARELQPRWAVQGNLDPVYLLGGGSAMVAEIGAILDVLGGGPFVFNLGHGILPTTPPENVALLVETVRAWRP